MKNDFVTKGRSVSDLKAHLVLTTKYRRSSVHQRNTGEDARDTGRPIKEVGVQDS